MEAVNCLLPLKEKSTFYNKVPLHDYFARLKGGSGSLEATNIISLLSATFVWWANNPCVPKYVNRLEDAQKKLVRAKLLIDDKWLAAIATGSLLAVGNFSKQRPDWDSLPTPTRRGPRGRRPSAPISSRSSVNNARKGSEGASSVVQPSPY